MGSLGVIKLDLQYLLGGEMFNFALKPALTILILYFIKISVALFFFSVQHTSYHIIRNITVLKRIINGSITMSQ